MPSVRITGWESGLKKVSLTKAICAETSLGLADSKACTDRVLAGESVNLSVSDDAAAVRLAEDLRRLGAVVEVQVDPVLPEGVTLSDIRVDVGRASCGGTFVRVRHIPTGEEVSRSPIGSDSPESVTQQLLAQLFEQLSD